MLLITYCIIVDEIVLALQIESLSFRESQLCVAKYSRFKKNLKAVLYTEIYISHSNSATYLEN